MKMIGIVGLGLIGGSLAKSAKKNTECLVFGADQSHSTVAYAKLCGMIDGELTEKNLGECDLVFLALYPEGVNEYIRSHGAAFKKGSLVLDCAGVKRAVCEPCFAEAEKNGFHFIGGHPMAGTQYSGIKYAKDTLFRNACFVLAPKPDEDVNVLEQAREAVLAIGFSRITVLSPEKHDKLIAFTSQLAHVVSNAYVKSPCAKEHKGISAGSYMDLTRVAYLNETMWTELFLDNRDNLINEVDGLIRELRQYSDAMKENNAEKLRALLKEGREAKEKIDLKKS